MSNTKKTNNQQSSDDKWNYVKIGFQELAENANDAIFIIQKGIIIYANKKAVKFSKFYKASNIAYKANITDIIAPEDADRVIDIFKKRVAGQKVPNKYESLITIKNGKTKPVEITVALTEWRNEKASFVIMRDISKKKEMEEALKISEKKYRSLIEQQEETICSWLPNGEITFANKKFYQFFNRKKSEVIREKWFNLLRTKENKELGKEIFENIIKKPRIITQLYKFTKNNGKVCYHEWIVYPIFNKERKVIEFRSIGRDITDRKKAQLKLAKSEERYKLLADKNPDIIFIYDTNGTYINMNKAGSKFFSKKIKDIIGKNVTELLPKESADHINKDIKEVLKTKKTIKVERTHLVNKKRGIQHFSKIMVPLFDDDHKKITSIMGITREITESKKAENALRESEERLRKVYEVMPGGIVVLDENCKISEINELTCKVTGYKKSELIGKKCTIIYPQNENKCFSFDPEKEIITNNQETVIKTKDGKLINIIKSSRKIKIQEKDFVIENFLDISQQKETEKALEATEEKFRDFVENLNDVAYRLNKDGIIIYINKKAEEILHHKRENIIGKHFSYFFHDEYSKFYEQIFKKNIKLGINFEGEMKTKNGRFGHFKNEVTRNHKNEIDGVFGIIRDITDKRHLEDLNKQKLDFQNTISKISSRFVGIFDLKSALNESLKEIGELTQSDRAYVFKCQESGKHIDNIAEWCKEGIKPQIDNLQNVSIESRPWFLQSIEEQKFIYVKDTNKLPNSLFEKKSLKSQGVKSLIALPIYIKGKLQGLVGLDNVKVDKEQIEQNFAILQITSEIFANAIEIKKQEQEIEQNIRKLQKAKSEWESTVDALPHIVCLINKKGEILRANKTVERWNMGKIPEIKNKNICDVFFKGKNSEKIRKNWPSTWNRIAKGTLHEIKTEGKLFGKHLKIQVQPIGKLDKKEQNENFTILVIYDVTERIESQKKIFELYKHLGLINRRVSILLNLNKGYYLNDKINSLDFITKSAKNISQAAVCMLYEYEQNEDKFKLRSYSGKLKNPKDDILEINTKDHKCFNTLTTSKTRVQGTCDDFDLKSFEEDDKLKSCLVIPVFDDNEINGAIFLGFNKKDGVSTQELDFYNLFVVHASLMMDEKI
ncbi:MAG: PAS domain S-box protein [Candidatus Gracilibacteria bacterium]|jgi:PAS domain S-box-containing protein|nr:PAS domain S-box protein [Candidatus Gracilibacteria bacterium]